MNNAILYEFINDYHIERWTKSYVILNGKQISHPTEDILKQLNIKRLKIDGIPDYDNSTHRLSEYYENTDDFIVKKWRIEEIPEEELLMMEALEGGELYNEYI